MTKKKSNPVKKEETSPEVDFGAEEVKTESKFSKWYIHNEKPGYWKGKVMINGSIVSGRVTKAEMKHFMDLAPKNIDLNKWIFPVDKIAERRKAIKLKMKAKLGLED